ncbi:hypothetical protein SALBM217S_01154 [Streptomyces griseoloalbus]
MVAVRSAGRRTGAHGTCWWGADERPVPCAPGGRSMGGAAAAPRGKRPAGVPAPDAEASRSRRGENRVEDALADAVVTAVQDTGGYGGAVYLRSRHRPHLRAGRDVGGTGRCSGRGGVVTGTWGAQRGRGGRRGRGARSASPRADGCEEACAHPSSRRLGRTLRHLPTTAGAGRRGAAGIRRAAARPRPGAGRRRVLRGCATPLRRHRALWRALRVRPGGGCRQRHGRHRDGPHVSGRQPDRLHGGAGGPMLGAARRAEDRPDDVALLLTAYDLADPR